MERGRVPYQKIVFVCVNKRAPQDTCCAHRDSEAIATALKAHIKELGLARHVRVSTSGCQDVCAKGPNVMVFPDHAWYQGVTLDNIERIVHDLTRDQPPAATASTAADRGRESRTRRAPQPAA